MQAAEGVQKIGRERPLGIVRSAIGVAPRDGIIKFTRFTFPRRKIYAGHEFGLGIGRNRLQLSWFQGDRRGVAVGGCGEQQILQRAAQAEMFFAEVGIERADVAPGIEVQFDRGVGDFESPGLGVVRAGGEDRGAHQGQRNRLSRNDSFYRARRPALGRC